MLEITERLENGMMILALDGRIDSEGAVQFDVASRNALQKGLYKIVLDMAAVRYLNSSGLRSLADVLTQSQAGGGGLRVVTPSERVQRIFEVAGFDKFFKPYESIEEAAASF
jgi:anti-anti-sigma factor